MFSLISLPRFFYPPGKSLSPLFDCTALETLDLPVATNIGGSAFRDTGGTALTITPGGTVPAPGKTLFDGVSAAKPLTVRVPSGAGSGRDASWQDSFKGGNSYITVRIETYWQADGTSGTPPRCLAPPGVKPAARCIKIGLPLG